VVRAGIVTCLDLPEPDPDQALLVAALERAGIEPVVAAWDDPSADWGGLDVAVLRSTWNYHLRLGAFLAWAEETARRTTLFNAPEVIRWNADKRYLLDLASRGFRVVPTEIVDRGAQADLEEILARRSWCDVVLKPAVSAGSFETHRVDRVSGPPIFDRLVAERDVMVQPYLGSVETYGERSMILIDGELTHAIRKSPRFAGGDERVEGPLPIAPEERALATAIWATLPRGLLYARVDLARDDRFEPAVMELELIEPSLFFLQSPPALERFVAAIARRTSDERTSRNPG
jgi:glutathione synthase/RimK-type ligase-like ATP-grasp enzyme